MHFNYSTDHRKIKTSTERATAGLRLCVKMFSNGLLRTFANETKPFVRYKNPPDHWSVLRKKVNPIHKALEHFDDFYKQVFKKKMADYKNWFVRKTKICCNNK
ncbi:hypothetical protein NQ317_007369 [Molorchus minor]|uniref:Uncharacterized protein n=1 Tax=Molorchus minor TaxID=1323400 RepID=A0ABQ9JCC2_9CUCU|nr:hypothetical protein NQ317_007369 [Molorchus minor]